MWKQLIGMVAAISLGVAAAWWISQQLNPAPAASVQPAAQAVGGDFTLQSAKGAVNLADFRGKVVALYFGYTACPDICPTSMATQKAAFAQLSAAEMAQVQGIFISVDPERDTLEHIQRYVGYFHPNIVGVSGTLPELETLARRYNAFFRKVEMPGSAMAYTIDHSSVIYVIDKQGKVQTQVQHAAPPAELAAAIRAWL